MFECEEGSRGRRQDWQGMILQDAIASVRMIRHDQAGETPTQHYPVLHHAGFRFIRLVWRALSRRVSLWKGAVGSFIFVCYCWETVVC
jgi:hypothetical protein